MFILEPLFHKALWGGNSLTSFYGEKAAGLAHLYSVVCRQEYSNIILNGRFAGRKLSELMNIPLSIAIVDAAKDLSIQVHPNDENAKSLESLETGKCEAWYFIKPPSSRYIYGGVNCSQNEFAAGKQNIMNIIKKVPVSKGDYVFVKPGTVHAMTAGSLVYEIEYGNDLTYRIYDYERTDSNGRKRETHIEKAVAVVDVSAHLEPQKYLDNIPLVEQFFATKLIKNISDYKNESNCIECLTIIDDSGEDNIIVNNVQIKFGMSVLLESGESIGKLNSFHCIVSHCIYNTQKEGKS